jgi:hypothetical protein
MADIAEPIRFGFLSERLETTFSHGSIVPVANFEHIAKAISKLLHKDGYLYPPIEKERVIKPGSKHVRTIPKTKRPAHLFCIPASHALHIVPIRSEIKVREESAAFIIYLLAFLFETRLQFEYWYIDGRIPIGHDIKPLASYSRVLGNQLSLGYKIWSEWKKPEQERFLNILYMFSRSDIYRWDWEMFLFQYSVLDACWKMGQALFHFKANSHGKRVHEIYSHFGLKGQLLDETKDFAKLRNDLVHEATWLGGRPSHVNPLTAGPGFSVGTRMAWLNRHVIASLLHLEPAFGIGLKRQN